MRPRKRYKVGYNEQIKDNAKSAYLIKESLNKGTLKPPSDAMVDPSGNPYVFALPAAIVGEEYTRDEQGRITFSSPLQRSNYFYNRNLGEEGISEAREMEASVREGTTNAVQGALQAYAAFSEPLGYLQKALVTAPLAQAMGKLDEVNLNPVAMLSGQDPGISSPSEALGIENPIGAFAVDALTDPLNFAGAGLLSAIRKQRMKGADIPFDLPEGVGGGGPARNLPSGDGGTPKKKPNRYVPAPLGDNAFVPKSLMDQGILAKQANPEGILRASEFERTMNSDNLSSGDKTYIRKAIEFIPGSVRENGDIDINALRSAVNTLFRPVVRGTDTYASYGARSVGLEQGRRKIPEDVSELIDDVSYAAAAETALSTGSPPESLNFPGEARSFLIQLEHEANGGLLVRPTNSLQPLSKYLPTNIDYEGVSSYFKDSEKSFFSESLKDVNGEDLPDALQTSYGPLVLRNDDGTYRPNVSERNLKSKSFWGTDEVLPQLNNPISLGGGISEDKRKNFLRDLAGLSEASQEVSKSLSIKPKNTELTPLLGDLENVVDSVYENVLPVFENLKPQLIPLYEYFQIAVDRDQWDQLMDVAPAKFPAHDVVDVKGNYLFDFSKYRQDSFSDTPSYNLPDQVEVLGRLKNSKDLEERSNIVASLFNRSRLDKDLEMRSVDRLLNISGNLTQIEKSFELLNSSLEDLKKREIKIRNSEDPLLKLMFDAFLEDMDRAEFGNFSSPDGKENILKIYLNTKSLEEFISLSLDSAEYLTIDQLGRRLSIVPAVSTVFQGTKIDHKTKFYAEALKKDVNASSSDLYMGYIEEEELLASELKKALEKIGILAFYYTEVAKYTKSVVDDVNEIVMLSRGNMMVRKPYRNRMSLLNQISLYGSVSEKYAKAKSKKENKTAGIFAELIKRGKDPSKINVGNTNLLFSANVFAKNAGFKGPGQLIETDPETGIKSISSEKREFTHFRDESESPDAWGHARIYVDPEEPTEMIVLEVQSDLFQIGKDKPRKGVFRRKKEDFSEIETPFLKQLKSGLSGYERAQIYSIIQQAVNNGQESILFPTKETVTMIEGYQTANDWRDYDDPSDRIEAAKSPIDMKDSYPEPGDMPEDYSNGIEKIRDGYENLARAISKELNIPLEKIKRKGYEYYKFDIPEKFVKREGEMPVFAKGGKFTINKIKPKKFLRAMKKK